MRPSRRRFACMHGLRLGPYCPTRKPPSVQGSFARSGCCPVRRGLGCRVGGSYPTVVARTSPCAEPKPSRRFRIHAYATGLCRLSLIPAGRWPFPTITPLSLLRCLDPYPVAFLRCSDPLLPEGHRPHLRGQRFGTPDARRHATSTTRPRLQSFHYVQAPHLARPPGCTHRWTFVPRAAGPFTPRIARAVTQRGMWYRYVLETGNWHGGTCTRWIAALSAAPTSILPAWIGSSLRSQNNSIRCLNCSHVIITISFLNKGAWKEPALLYRNPAFDVKSVPCRTFFRPSPARYTCVEVKAIPLQSEAIGCLVRLNVPS